MTHSIKPSEKAEASDMTILYAHPTRPLFTVFECVELEHEELAFSMERVATVVERMLADMRPPSKGANAQYRVELARALCAFREAGAEASDCMDEGI